MKKVLILGIDPKFIDVNLATSTGWDANRVKAVAQEANNKLREQGSSCPAAVILRMIVSRFHNGSEISLDRICTTVS
jgi:hypothetical protein